MGWVLTWSLGEESISKLIQAVGRSQFLMVVGLRSLFPCLLSMREEGHSMLLDPSLYDVLPITAHQIFLLLQISDFFLSDQPGKTLCC